MQKGGKGRGWGCAWASPGRSPVLCSLCPWRWCSVRVACLLPLLMLPVLVVFVSDNIHYVINKAFICHFFLGAGSPVWAKIKQAINQ